MKASSLPLLFCLCVPAAVAEAQRPPLRDVTIAGIPGVIAAGVVWQHAWDGTDNADGLTGYSDGSVLFAQEQTSTIRRLDARDYDAAYVKDTHGAGSVAVDAHGRLVAVQRTCTDPGRGTLPCTEPTKIAIIHPDRARTVLADSIGGKPMGRLNDLVVGRNGTVYFTMGGAYALTPGGPATVVAEDIRSNGIMLSPDEKTLYVTNGPQVIAFDVRADGSVTNRRDFATLPAGNGDGMAVDGVGRLYVTAQAAGIHVFSPGGMLLGTIPTPRDVISVAFAGPQKRTLYVVGSGALGPNGKEFILPDGVRNNAKTIYKIPMLAQGFTGRAK